jgi:hypothetical protein
MCKELKDDYAKLTELRLDYAWKYFESASRQRMLFLNYFLIAVGILASAYGFALKEEIYLVAIYVCVFGLIASIGFIIFDIRMLAFVERALNTLETLEREDLFKDGYLHAKPSGVKGQQLGLARIEPDCKKSGDVNCSTGHTLTKTKWWLRAIEGTAAIGFAFGIVLAIQLLVSNNTQTDGGADEPNAPQAEIKADK